MPPSNTPPVVVAPGTQTQSHIGVPNDYRPPPVRTLYGTQDIPGQRPYSESVMGQAIGSVRYKPGAEFAPLNNPETVLQLQAQLVQVGYLDAKKVRPGVWDANSAAAYRRVLGFANQNGVNAQDALAFLAANPTLGQQQGGATRAPLTIEETNPLDIAATAQGVAQKLFGRQLSDEELKPFIAQVQSQQRAVQQKAYAMGGTKGEGGTLVRPPSIEAASEDYYRKAHPDEAYGYAAVERMNDFYSLLHTPVQ